MNIEHLFDSITPQESMIMCHTQHIFLFLLQILFFFRCCVATVAWQISDAIRDRESEYVMRSIRYAIYSFFCFFFDFFDRIFQTHNTSNPLFIDWLDCCHINPLLHIVLRESNLLEILLLLRLLIFFYVLVNIGIVIKRSQYLLPFGK